ncbi:hypothetical protein K470DRAFT_286876 [Piedraia hortae CBS 480.64]|uniref:Uncharacterized protein n=1 Tax=Piedraia hortae CBS 480.64 TaxID=1314780 RepID=A0A6A7C093_9PEZI|nr:hypothetical protein K470DRAFT_286876 [Piedraia hortae CBS 480.64]
MLEVSETTVVFLEETQVMDTRAKEDVEFVPQDEMPRHEDFGSLLRTPYTAKKFYTKHDARVVQLNVSFWQDGVSAARGTRWNHLEVWTMNSTGFSRRMSLGFPFEQIIVRTEPNARPGLAQFHVSANYFVAVGAKMKATSMLRGLMPNLVRPQRGVRAFNSRSGRPVIISGCACRFMADNPAAAALCSIRWHDFYWRWAVFNQWKDLTDVPSLGLLRHTKG